jgi:hypothetical protein
MIRQSDPWRVRWDLLVMFCAVYNCIIVPYEIAFMHEEESNELLFVSVVIDVVFTFDIIFNFRTTFIDTVTGDEVTDPHKISHHYIKSGHLLLDILATLPFDHLFEADDSPQAHPHPPSQQNHKQHPS